MKPKIKNKIGFCKNKYLFKNSPKPNDGHYVYIRDMDNKGICSVSVFTSLEKPDYSYNLKNLYYTK